MTDIEDIGKSSCKTNAKIDIDKISTNIMEDEKEVAQNNLVYGFEDRFAEVTDINPYYKHSRAAKAMNFYSDPKKLVIPSTLKNKTDEEIAYLKEYTQFILEEVINNTNDYNNYNIVFRKACSKFKIAYKKVEIFYAYQLICENMGTKVDPEVMNFLQGKPSRSDSGVMVFAVFTHPMWRESKTIKINNETDNETNNETMKSFSCEYDCSYCPQQPGRPRSYVDGEPGNDRAVSVNYDTKSQIYVRGNTYRANGHPIDKAEVIVLGGTFHSYDSVYHEEFFRNLYFSFNTINGEREREMLSLEEEMLINTCMDNNLNELYSSDHNICRVIGLTIETRPDQINARSIKNLRRFGVTRVQLGVQHTDDRVLLRVNRGCTNADSINAILNLKRCNFKVDIHLMPDLPRPYTEEFVENNKSSLKSNKIIIKSENIDWDFDMIKSDREMFDLIFHGEDYAPDQCKIYPFQVMDWTKLKGENEKGLHVSYADIKESDDASKNELVKTLIDVKSRIPPYVRINRLKRDIPDSYSLGGLTDSHGREYIHKLMKKMNLKCKCIRCNEIKKKEIDLNDVFLKVYKYRASEADEYFIYYTDAEDHIIGFVRLRLDKLSGYFTKYKKNNINNNIKREIRSQKLLFKELANCAMIRELHVYGQAIKVENNKSKSESLNENAKSTQHLGFGTRLIYAALIIAHSNGYDKMSVIPGEGVKQYYSKKFGFKVEHDYMTLDISDLSDKIKNQDSYQGIDGIVNDPEISCYCKNKMTICNDKNTIYDNFRDFLDSDIFDPHYMKLHSCDIQ
jgi:histone acetyltransferase (RNA polymerase elongator complex component)